MPRYLSDILIDKAGNAIAFGIIGVLGAVAIGVKIAEQIKPRDSVVLNTQSNGGVVSGTASTTYGPGWPD